MTDSKSIPTQLSLLEPSIAPAVSAAIANLSLSEGEERGAIFTKREVVDFILDLVEYTPEKPLHKMRLLEPSFGNGDFLLPAVERLLKAYRKQAKAQSDDVTALKDAIRAVELHHQTFKATRKKLASLIQENKFNNSQARTLIRAWLIQGDFLLEEIDGEFTHIVGNPPYVRQELIPDALMNEYRSRFHTIYDRADIYIPFIEKSLSLLTETGSLGFICSDRWMKNRYGGPLRRLVAERFHLKCYVDMVDTLAFHSDVIAYPAITIIQNGKPGPTRLAHRPQVDQETLSKLARSLLSGDSPSNSGVKELSGVTRGTEPWILESQDQLAVVRRLEATFPTLEEANCKVGIGVATGADGVFIAPFDELDVEPSRKLPLAMTRDILTGKVQWRGYGVINPFDPEGGLVPLSKYPKLAAYMTEHGTALRNRHVAKRNPEGWYRTIDRIYPALAEQPKLLIPDIKGEANIVYEDGRLYPHHNLYFIVSKEWDLKALQAVLKSGIARLFVSIYSTKMRGGYLRYQAQYLRRIRVPRWSGVTQEIKTALTSAIEDGDDAACNDAVYKMYGLTKNERAAIGGNGE